MTQAMFRLEIFETAELDGAPEQFNAHEAEKLRETAFEQGYASGWQDALEQLRNEDDLRRAAAEEALQAVSFTYAEAHQTLQDGFMALTRNILEKVLPDVARHALPEHLRIELDALVASNTHTPIEILCAPSVLPALKKIAESYQDRQIRMIAEPSFSEAQVALRLGQCERAVDLDAILERLAAMVNARLPECHTKEKMHG